MKDTEKYLVILPEVQDALQTGKPIVALESTIISHGMRYPRNVQTAREVEKMVREAGAVPATIALLEGRIRIGIEDNELDFLGSSGEVKKAGSKDIPLLISQKGHGATTVSGTMYCASLVGIRVFVTGGIGGVHRGGATTFDISADLTELSRTSVAVICAGAKSILDLALTLEKLETLGVPVIGYRTDEFPSFYSRKSGLKVDTRVDSPQEAAAIMRAKWDIGPAGGMVIANPIPEEEEIPAEIMQRHIDRAIENARDAQIRGKELTPYLLDNLFEITCGKSLEANISLVKHNARVGGEIAAAYAVL